MINRGQDDEVEVWVDIIGSTAKCIMPGGRMVTITHQELALLWPNQRGRVASFHEIDKSVLVEVARALDRKEKDRIDTAMKPYREQARRNYLRRFPWLRQLDTR